MSVANALLQVEQARALLRALAGGERCVCDLTADLGLAQSKLSFHLRMLKEAGLLADRQEGRWIYYRLRPEAIEQLRDWLQGRCVPSIQGLLLMMIPLLEKVPTEGRFIPLINPFAHHGLLFTIELATVALPLLLPFAITWTTVFAEGRRSGLSHTNTATLVLITVGNTYEPALAGVIDPTIKVPMLVALSSLQPRSALHTLLLGRTVERGTAA